MLIALLVIVGQAGAADPTAAAPVSPVRLAFSTGVIGEINHNDARASIIAWGRAVLSQRTISASGIVPSIHDRPAELFRLILTGELDGAAVMLTEFLARPATLGIDAVFLTAKNGKFSEQYVLLVHRASGITDLPGLTGRSLELHQSARTSLARAWLDLILHGAGLGRAGTVFKRIVPSDKASRAVMRVFFRQADSVVVTRGAFATMSELNPQLGKELRVLATSPEVIPTAFFLRPDLASQLKQEMEAAIVTVHETVAGRQALTVFQGDMLEKRPLSDLQSGLDLLAAAARLPDAIPVPAASPLPPASPPANK